MHCTAGGLQIGNMILKQTLKTHYKVLNFAIIVLIMILAACYFLFEKNNNILTGALAFYFITTSPALYLHWRYFKVNANQTIEINNTELRIRNNNHEISHLTSDFVKVIINKSASLDKGGIPLSALEYYYFIKIINREKEEIIITCLMHQNIEAILPFLNGIPIERNKNIFCIWV